jgi:hypothetical protein
LFRSQPVIPDIEFSSFIYFFWLKNVPEQDMPEMHCLLAQIGTDRNQGIRDKSACNGIKTYSQSVPNLQDNLTGGSDKMSEKTIVADISAIVTG